MLCRAEASGLSLLGYVEATRVSRPPLCEDGNRMSFHPGSQMDTLPGASHRGDVAQLGERVMLSPSIAFLGRGVRVTDCTGEVAGSSPAVSTMTGRNDWVLSGPGTPDHASSCPPAVTACLSCLGERDLAGRSVQVIVTWPSGRWQRAFCPNDGGSNPPVTASRRGSEPVKLARWLSGLMGRGVWII
jgi:hypothetical protein